MYGFISLYMIEQALILAVLAPLVAGLIKICKARLQNRRGPRLFQVYFDLFKLFSKDSIVSPTVSWLFMAAPFIYFATAIAIAAMAPIVLRSSFSELFLLLYLFALGRFFLALASLDAGSTFGGMGSSREMFIATLAEPAILLALMTIAFRSGSTSLTSMGLIAGNQMGLAAVFSAVAFFIVLLAETGRIPVDNPDTHLELTMVHEGMVLEYSGRWLGLIEWAAAIKQLVLILLFVNLFIPWPPSTWLPAGQLIIMVFKVAICVILLALTETLTNKMRLFKIPGFLAGAGLLALLAIVAQ